MATHLLESRVRVRTYLRMQWTTMKGVLGDPAEDEGRKNFKDFEAVLSFPYNRKLAWFPADLDIGPAAEGRARGVFGEGSLLPDLGNTSYNRKVAHHSAMLASLYARQEFIRAAARYPMTLFIGPMPVPEPQNAVADAGQLLTSEKFSRVVFSGLMDGPAEYVAVVELSRIYPQTAVARVWFTGTTDAETVVGSVQERWAELAGSKRVIRQRGDKADQGIKLLSKALENVQTRGMYVQHVDSRALMWANVIALTASDNHADTNLLKQEKLWKSEAEGDLGLDPSHWMAAMLALRRIPYIVKNDEKEDANREQLPHPLTIAEAGTVRMMLSQIIRARSGAEVAEEGSSGQQQQQPSQSRFTGDDIRKRVTFADCPTESWW